MVERWLPRINKRKDYLGCIDIIAVKPQESVLGVQATVTSAMSTRLNKATDIPELATWLSSGARFQVWGWSLIDGRWRPKVVEVHSKDMWAEVITALPRRRRKPRHVPGDLFKDM